MDSTTERRRALENADVVNWIIRVGGMDARIQDGSSPTGSGFHGQHMSFTAGYLDVCDSLGTS